MMNKTLRRVLPALLSLLLLLTLPLALAGCAGKRDETPSTSWTSADGDDAVTYFSRILPTNAEAREKFTAASRGYNMEAEGFDPNAEAPDRGTVDLEAAKAALNKVRPTDDASIAHFDSLRDNLTEENVRAIVARMGETVELKTKNGPLATVLLWIGKFLQVLTKMTGGNYVLALFIFAVVLEIVMVYFSIRQQKTAQKQAMMRPKEMAIRKKYAGRNDQVSQQKMNQEIQKMYQEEGFNPMGGCLPLLLQMPIVLALYQIVIDPLRYVLGKAATLSTALTTYCTTAKAAGGLGLSLSSARKGTIELLSQLTGENLEGLKSFAYFANATDCYTELSGISIPNFNLFGTNMGLIPGFHKPWGLLAIPVLTFLFYFASMKLNRKMTYQPAVVDQQTGCSNNIMDITMPLMSVYIAFIVPAAVGIYWIFKCVLSTLKQFILHKVMPLPTFTEEDYKQAERELKGKTKNTKPPAGTRVGKSGTPVRSLHHIDDDDEPLPPPERDPVEPAEKKPVQKDGGKNAGKAAEKAVNVPGKAGKTETVKEAEAVREAEAVKAAQAPEAPAEEIPEASVKETAEETAETAAQNEDGKDAGSAEKTETAKNPLAAPLKDDRKNRE